jgi:hypothetical protein
LEIDRHVEACDHHVRAEEEVCHATGPDNPLTEHRQRNHGLVTLSVLPQQEATSAPADPQNNPMTIALLHLYVVPPHSIASRNMIAADAKMVKPEGAEDGGRANLYFGFGTTIGDLNQEESENNYPSCWQVYVEACGISISFHGLSESVLG